MLRFVAHLGLLPCCHEVSGRTAVTQLVDKYEFLRLLPHCHEVYINKGRSHGSNPMATIERVGEVG